MERIGERLRRRREELGLTLEDVSESIRYRPEVIRAIEEGRSSVFPAKAYLSAFLRAYAVILELDPQEIVRDQKSEEERAFEAIRNIRVKPKRQRKFPRRILYILVPIVLAVVLLFVVDRFLWERGPDPGPEPVERPGPAISRPDTVAQDSTTESGVGLEAAGAENRDGTAGEPPETETTPPETRETDNPVEDAEGDDAGGDDSAGGETVEEDVTTDASSHDDSPEGVPPAARGTVLDGAEEAEADREDVIEAQTAETTGQPGEVAGAEMPPETEPEAMVPPAETETAPEPRRHKLVVSARRGAYISIANDGRSVFDGFFRGGEVDSFFSETPFVIVALTERGAWTFVQDGERVRLPGSSSEDVSNFVIPLPSDD